MRVGILYDLFEDYPWQTGEPGDADAENEPAETLEAISGSLGLLGHEAVALGTSTDLLKRGAPPAVDVVVNISEGAHSRNREGFGPTLLEMMGIPFVGPDALTLSLSLDKASTKDLAVAAGLETPAYVVYKHVAVLDDAMESLPFPLMVKPRYEGSAKGITIHSRVEDEAALREEVRRITEEYAQDALVESFVEGAEYTVALAGHEPVETFPVMQRAVEKRSGIGLHALERRSAMKADWEYELPGELSAELEERLRGDALAIFHKLECRDFARVDFRVDSGGRAWFLEINPLPTFAPDGTFAILAEMMAVPYERFLADTLGRAIERVMRTKRETKTLQKS